MKSRKGFTMIELMVVIIIVGILAAVAVPLMRGNVDQAKWSEAAAAAGAIRSANRAYFAEKGVGIAAGAMTTAKASALGFRSTDLNGTWFVLANYSVGATNATTGLADITVTNAAFVGYTGVLNSSGWTLTLP